MSKVAVVTDSCASIPEAMIDELGIRWAPYYVHRGEEVLRDLVTVHRQPFYEWLARADSLPTTASPGPGDYVEIYRDLADKGAEEIVSLHMTSKGSGAFQAAKVAQSTLKEILPEIRTARILVALLYSLPRMSFRLLGRSRRFPELVAGSFAGEHTYGALLRRALRRPWRLLSRG